MASAVGQLGQNRSAGFKTPEDAAVLGWRSRRERSAFRASYFAGKTTGPTSVTETWEGDGSSPFCLAPTIEAQRSAALASMGLGAT